MIYLFHELPKNVIRSFKKRNALIHLFAILITIAIVYSGLDWTYFILTRNDFLLYIFFQAVILGGILPIIVPIFMVIWGIYKDNIKLKIAGWAVGQSALLGLTISSIYKMFTGRIEPNLADAVHDISNSFNFGFLKHGVFFGWPSSHTTVAFAITFTVFIIYSKNRPVKFIALLYALYVGIGVATVGIHWLSEFVAGSLIGAVIGITVGKSFKKIIDQKINFKPEY